MAKDAAKARPRQTRRWRQADRQKRSDLVIQVALDLLHRRGLEAVTMRNVARRLGVGAMTLYTYIDGQDQLRLEMARQGFGLLNDCCEAASTLDAPGTIQEKWRGGARAYVQFAIDNPNLYDLMFHVPPARAGKAASVMRSEFGRFFDKVREHQSGDQLTPAEVDLKAQHQAERFWIALHGLASLAIADRLSVVGVDIDRLLDDLLQHIISD